MTRFEKNIPLHTSIRIRRICFLRENVSKRCLAFGVVDAVKRRAVRGAPSCCLVHQLHAENRAVTGALYGVDAQVERARVVGRRELLAHLERPRLAGVRERADDRSAAVGHDVEAGAEAVGDRGPPGGTGDRRVVAVEIGAGFAAEVGRGVAGAVAGARAGGDRAGGNGQPAHRDFRRRAARCRGGAGVSREIRLQDPQFLRLERNRWDCLRPNR